MRFLQALESGLMGVTIYQILKDITLIDAPHIPNIETWASVIVGNFVLFIAYCIYSK